MSRIINMIEELFFTLRNGSSKPFLFLTYKYLYVRIERFQKNRRSRQGSDRINRQGLNQTEEKQIDAPAGKKD